MNPAENTTEKLKQLLDKPGWDDADRLWMANYLDKNDSDELKKIMEEKFAGDSMEQVIHPKLDQVLNAINQKIDAAPAEAPVFFMKSRKKISIAACVLLLIGLGAYFAINNATPKNKTIANAPSLKNDITPGHDNATLTLADGTSIVLDNAANGELARQGNSNILKVNGQIAYTKNRVAGAEVMYNTMSTARGNQYQLQLADGSKVWLNAASSIRFPAAFTGNERKVSITGEAYFEVAHDAAHPFKVAVNGMTITVLGTHFNVNAYSDEATVKATLLEGAVQLSSQNSTRLLQPGQQAQMGTGGFLKVVNKVDIDEVVAWKNGAFIFNSADIESIMRQVGRWYDVDAVYEGQVSKETFSGIVNRKSDLLQVLKIIEEGGVRFKIEGRKIIFSK